MGNCPSLTPQIERGENVLVLPCLWVTTVVYLSFMATLTSHLPTSLWTEQLVVVKSINKYNSFFLVMNRSLFIAIFLLDIYKCLRLNVF